MNDHAALILTDSLRLGAGAWVHALWAAPAIALAMWLASHRSRSLLRRVASPEMLARLAGTASRPRRALKGALVVAATALTALALARPQLGFREQTAERRGRDIVFLVDVSRSMLAEDLAPNRLERAKLWMKDLVDAAEGDRIGIIAFAGAPVIRSPLTLDRDFVEMAIDELDPGVATRGGTNIGDAIRKAVEQVFALDPDADTFDERAAYRDIILITDGEDQGSFPVEAATAAGELGVRIIALGIGSSGQGAPVPGKEGAEYETYEGQIVRSSLNAEPLAEIAAASNAGAFLNVGAGSIELDAVYDDLIASAEQTQQDTVTTRKYIERFAWVLAPALACLVLEGLITDRRRRR